MKIRFIILALVISALSGLADEGKKVPMTGVARIDQMIGYLNVPFGTIITVTGRVKLVPEDNRRFKGSQSRYFIVTQIGKKKLEEEVAFNLWSDSLPKAKHYDKVTAKVNDAGIS